MLSTLGRTVRDWLGLPPCEADANARGIRHYERGEFRAALQAFEEALLVAPRAPGIWCNRANACYRLGRPEQAIADFTRALEAEPNLDAYFCRAMVLAEMGKTQEAIDDLTRALRLDRTSTLLYRTRADLWCQLDRLDEAWADYDSLLRLDASRADAWAMRGRVSDLLGRPDQALDDYEQVLRRADSTDPVVLGTTHNNRGHIHHRRGAYAQARADFDAAIRLAPELPNGYKNLAWLQATCPDPSFRNGPAAVANAKRAWELSHGKKLEWLDIIAASFAEAGQFPDAIRWQEEAIASAADSLRLEQASRLTQYQSGQPHRDAANRRLREERVTVSPRPLF